MAAGRMTRNTRTLMLKAKCHMIRERGQGLLTLEPGTKVKVTFSPGTGYGTAYAWEGGEHWSSCVEASKGPQMFANWPSAWVPR